MKRKIYIGILLFIIIIAIILVIGYFSKTKNPSKLPNTPILEENSTSNEFNTTVTNTTLDSNEINNSITFTSNTNAEDKCKKVLETYLKLLSDANTSPAMIFQDLGFKYELDYNNRKDFYILSEVKYKDFENEMLKYMTKELLEKIENPEYLDNEKLYENLNGFVAILDIGASGKTYSIKDMNLISSGNDTISFNVKSICTTGEYEETEEFTANFKLLDEIWVVSEVTYNN